MKKTLYIHKLILLVQIINKHLKSKEIVNHILRFYQVKIIIMRNIASFSDKILCQSQSKNFLTRLALCVINQLMKDGNGKNSWKY